MHWPKKARSCMWNVSLGIKNGYVLAVSFVRCIAAELLVVFCRTAAINALLRLYASVEFDAIMNLGLCSTYSMT